MRKRVFDFIGQYPYRIEVSAEEYYGKEDEVLLRARELYAKLLRTEESNIILTPEPQSFLIRLFSSFISIGDRSILLIDEDTCRLHEVSAFLGDIGFRVNYADIKPRASVEEEIVKLINGYTFTCIPHLFIQIGLRPDVSLIHDVARSFNSLLALDASYTIGTVDIDIGRCDVLYAESGHWLMTPPGASVAYINSDVFNNLSPSFHKTYLEMGGRPRYMNRLRPYAPVYKAAIKSIQGILREGIKNVEMRILNLTQWVIDELSINPVLEVLTPISRRRRAGLVVFKGDFNTLKLRDYLYDHNIIVHAFKDRILISLHHTHTEDDVEELIRRIKEGTKVV